jgi:mono/diheme cytochrome c family protein
MPRTLMVLALALALAGCGGGESVSPTPDTVIGTIPEGETIEPGNAEAGKAIFTDVAQPSCGNCHTYGPAGTTQTLGPNLDEALQGKDAQSIAEQILNPDSEITEGFPDNLMPEDYSQKLSEKQLSDLVAFLLPQS